MAGDLVVDRRDEALRSLHHAQRAAQESAFHGDHDPWWWAMVHLYRGEAGDAADSVRIRAETYRRSVDSRLRINRVLLAYFQGLSEAAALTDTGDPTYAAGLRKMSRRLRGVRHRLSHPASTQLDAVIAATTSDESATRASLELAERAFAELEVTPFAGAVRYQRGRWTEGQAGENLSREATEIMTAEEVVKPARWASTLAYVPAPPR